MYLTRSRKKPKKSRNKKSRLAASAGKRRGSSNVFEDLGFEPAESAILKIRADLMIDLRRFIQDRRWTQAEAAQFFAETQARISNLLKGEISRFSVDKLINMLVKAGIMVQVETKQRAA